MARVRTSHETAADNLNVFPPVPMTHGTNRDVVAAFAKKYRSSSLAIGSFIMKTSPSVKSEKPGLNLPRKYFQKLEQKQQQMLTTGRKTQTEKEASQLQSPDIVDLMDTLG